VGDDALVRKVDTTAKWWLRLGRCMLAALALAEDVPVGAFDAMTNESFWIMRLIHSPGAEDDEEKVSTGAHTDYGFLSFLDATASGLQVDCDGEWRDVPNIPGTVACNVGEMLQLFMEVDGVSAFKACRHRVVRRRDADADAAKSRFSIAFFLEPNYDACVAPRQLTADANDPTYAARVVRYSEFLKSKVKTNFICPDD
jgi:isopenicillin N synthase-like dioxygenase